MRLHLNLALGEIASLLGSDKFLEFKGAAAVAIFAQEAEFLGSWRLLGKSRGVGLSPQ